MILYRFHSSTILTTYFLLIHLNNNDGDRSRGETQSLGTTGSNGSFVPAPDDEGDHDICMKHGLMTDKGKLKYSNPSVYELNSFLQNCL
jgi:hypothetical protein